VYYQVGGKPAVAKLTILQQRLYCLKVKATKPAAPNFFEVKSLLRADMQVPVSSYDVLALSTTCLERSNQGSVQGDGACTTLDGR